MDTDETQMIKALKRFQKLAASRAQPFNAPFICVQSVFHLWLSDYAF